MSKNVGGYGQGVNMSDGRKAASMGCIQCDENIDAAPCSSATRAADQNTAKSRPTIGAMRIPETADSAPAIVQVTIDVAFVLMPESAAAYGLRAVARNRSP